MFEEHKYKKLKELGTELHIPIFEAFLKMEVFDKAGKLVHEHSQRSHSWVRNAYNLMFCQLAAKAPSDSTFEAGKLSIKDTSGSTQYGADKPLMSCPSGADPDSAGYAYLAPAGEDDWGILVGSGTNAESFEDYALDTQITEGTGGGQISYIASQAHAITYTAGTKVLKNDLIRFFNNNTGSSRAVNEVALVVFGAIYSYGHKWVQSRDHLASTVTVPDTGQLKVTYTIQITYPA